MNEEMLARIDERTKSMDEKLDQHIRSCETLYATKVDLNKAQTAPVIWIFTAVLASGFAFFGQNAMAKVMDFLRQ